MTPAELEKKRQFYSIYWSEYRLAKGNGELSELPDYLEERSVFDFFLVHHNNENIMKAFLVSYVPSFCRVI